MRYLLFLLLTFVLTAFIGWGTYQTARLLRAWKPDRNMLLLPAENALRIGLVLACLGLGLLSGLPAATLGWQLLNPAADLLIGLAAGVLLSLGLTGLARLARLASRPFGIAIYSPTVILNVLPRNRREWLLVALALAPSVALEELLFRSLLLGGLSPLLPAWLLVPGISALFGLMHLPQGWLGVAGTALAGIVFSLLFLGTGGLLAPLAAHYVADILQLVQAGQNREELARMESRSDRDTPLPNS